MLVYSCASCACGWTPVASRRVGKHVRTPVISVTIDNSLPGANFHASAMSLWDMLPPDIEMNIAMMLVASIVGINGKAFEGDPRAGTVSPNCKERVQNLQILRAWRLMRKSFCIALRPIHLLYKPIQSAHHANAFVTGLLLILEQLAVPKEACTYFWCSMYNTIWLACSQKRTHPDDQGAQSASYYNALKQNVAVMLENDQLSLSKFQPLGWRVRFLVRTFSFLDRFYVNHHSHCPEDLPLPKLTDMINQTVRDGVITLPNVPGTNRVLEM